MTKKPHPALVVTGARENNLQNVTVALQHDLFTCVTGLSGSGKSSLAFDTVYAEGQRRYIETFSPYTRQFFDKVKKPDVLSLENVRPSIAIQQRVRVTSSRSTVGSMTNMNDFLKVLWSNLSTPVSPKTGKPLVRWTPSTLAAKLIADASQYPEGTAYLIAAPVTLPSKKALVPKELDRLQLLGFSRVYLTKEGQLGKLEEVKASFSAGDTLHIVLDRVSTSRQSPDSLRESLEQAFQLGRGVAHIFVLAKDKSLIEHSSYSTSYQSSDPNEEPLPFSIPIPRPALFDANSPIGACEECKGFGKILEIDEAKVIPNPGLPLNKGAIQPWTTPSYEHCQRRLLQFADEHGIPTDTPWHKLSASHRSLLLQHNDRSFKGVFPWFEKLTSKAYKMHVRVFLARYRSQVTCPSCNGGRLKPASLLFRLHGLNLTQLWETPVEQLLQWAAGVREELERKSGESLDLAEVLRRFTTRLEYLDSLGLSYLSLGRQSRTLSGGETQRVNLATALGSDLVSTQFVLDEPSVGLHPRDTERLIDSFHSLRARGNSLLVVEHDLDCIWSADRVLEIGPKAGAEGGEVVFHGLPSEWPGVERESRSLPQRKLPKKFKSTLSIRNATARNLQGIDVDIPVGLFTTITGVSGSGKSTLVSEVIMDGYRLATNGLEPQSSENRVSGFEHFHSVRLIDQSSLAKSPRANIATYSGIWDVVRQSLADTEEAHIRSLTRSSFSFNVDGGRCPTCKGAGAIREDMQFLSDVYVLCDDCLGKRFQQKPLEVHYLGKNADDWLQTTIDECRTVFPSQSRVKETAEILVQLGLGHLRLGHSLSELSGGEAQRLKLVPYLQTRSSEATLFIFDEPSTGLHLYDVQNLNRVLRELTTLGHTVVCIEHNQELILASDFLIDLGPEGGDAGGKVVLTGSPQEFLTKKAREVSYTAHFLQEYLESFRNLSTKPRKQFVPASQPEPLTLVGAKEHNLKNVSLQIPHDQIVALTGISGSGKSTIAKDIIYAEGQRRYLDCLSPYARQFIRELSKPDIEEITNIRPTVCVYQHTFQPGRLSTVGTMSEVYNFLRLLFSKVGTQYCPAHPEQAVSSLSSDEIAGLLCDQGEKEVRLLAPIIKGKKGTHKAVFQRAIDSEIAEVRVDGVIGSPAYFNTGLEKGKQHDIDFVWAKIVPARVPSALVKEAVEEVFALGGGTVVVLSGKSEQVYSRERACPVCRTGFFKPDPEDLSFHSRRGRCQSCGGSGYANSGALCKSCEGMRLQPTGRNVRIGELNITELCLLTAPEIIQELRELQWPETLRSIVTPVLREVFSRLETLIALGLEYIPLDRSCDTLSGGELQRLRLSAALGTPLSGAMYIFDEPSAGLHPLDNMRVLDRLRGLKDAGNSVVLIEHDELSVSIADHIVEVGPGAGRDGGEITFNGSQRDYPGLMVEEEPVIRFEKTASTGEYLKISNASCNNIEELSLEIPLQQLVVVAGVSGAGKSSLLHGILYDTLEQQERGSIEFKSDTASIRSSLPVDRITVVDQSPIGKNSRSTPASYLKVWDEIRKLFAASVEARARGWSAGFFSYNSGDGRCQECKGLGRQRLEMSFLAEASVVCDYCRGSRYSDEALSVQYLGKNASEVLGMTFEEAKNLFANHKRIHRVLHTACEIGLGYLTLGQSSTTLSGGESQRIKLVSELSNDPRGHGLYILDEPTVGLHRRDVAKLLQVLKSLVSRGNSVFVIEHDRDVLEAADHLIEMGPGPGERGGRVIFQGYPKELRKRATPWGKLMKVAETTPLAELRAATGA